MNGTLWVVNGQPITVDPSVVRDGPFKVGDSLKVEAVVNPDGSITVVLIGIPHGPLTEHSHKKKGFLGNLLG